MDPTQETDPTALLSAAYTKYAGQIYRHCCFRTFNQEDAEELVQETFMRAWEYLTSGRKIDSLKLFLYRIANNLIIDEARKKKAKLPDLSLDRLMEEGFDIGHVRVDPIQRRSDMVKVLGALKKLKKGYYELLIMRYIDGIKPADIAIIMGISPNTVSVRLHRGIRHLTLSLKSTQVS
ncbi:MAG: RNA polymerase sigma factor [Candidatus Peregrinibacteria bacterium]|nr:RNA polymerase sigma factor [Candidatus Peregrinibacteria bacterium]